MAVKLAFNKVEQFCDGNGLPYAGAKLFTYTAGSTTKQTTYTDSAGSVPNTNPIVLDSAGRLPQPVWLTTGVSYKFVLAPSTDTDPPASPIWTLDNIAGINDTTVTFDEWKAGPTPTFVSATSFTLVGDQTSTFTVGRRVKTTNSGGTVYSTITASAFAALTTITVVNDSGTIDSGLSAVSYGLLQATNKAVPPFDMLVYLTSVAGTNTITASALKSAAGYSTGQTFLFTPANTNTGATTLNVNSLGAKNVFSDNAACVGGELKVGVPVALAYDGTQFQIIGRRFFKQPTRQVLTSGTGATYTTPAGCTRINVRMVGPGGGGGAQSANNGSSGSAATTFSTLSAGLGSGGSNGAGGGGGGGTAANGDINITGASGQPGFNNTDASVVPSGGAGAASAFGGGGQGGVPASGGSAAVVYGAGGGGGGGDASQNSGAGGGAGAYCEKLITAPATTYTYTVGTGGNGGAAGGRAGGNGKDGIIIVDEWYD